MDKNFVNLDDLVRQRLLGREEREPAGAWSRMNELLDKEMPRERPVGFVWRSRLGGLAVLALLGALSLGGYELNSYVTLNNNDHKGAIAAVNGTNTNDIHSSTTNTNNNTPAQANEVNATPLATTTSSATTAGNEQPAEDGGNKTGNNAVAANMKHSNHYTGNNTSADNKTTTRTSGQTAIQQTDNSPVTGSAVASNNNKENNNSNKADGSEGTNSPAANTAVAATNTKTNNERGAATKDAGKPTGDDKNNVTEKAPANGIANKADHKRQGSHKAGQSSVAVSNKSTTPAVAHTTPKTKHGQATTGNQTTGGEAPAQTSNSEDNEVAAVSNNSKPLTTKGHSRHTNTVKVGSLALGSSSAKAGTPGHSVADAGNVTPKHNGSHKTAGNSHTALTSKTPVVNANTGNSPVAATVAPKPKTGNKVAANSVTKSPATAGADKPANDVAAINARKGKRVIEKISLMRRFIQNNKNETIPWMDTVSIENITEEYDLANPSMIAEKTSGALTTGNEVASSKDPFADSSPKLSTFSSTSKENNFEKVTKGSKALEGLNAAFNDIKYKAGHAQFQAGITAGVNGTFFGPNGFKGFQFGFTGKLVFSDALAIMGELKYFHRINSDYTLTDNYYSYTPTAGGYIKELVKNPYSISTLHSIELPISLQYSVGKFNFAFGPNVVYTFGVNTGEYPMKVQSPTPVIVNTPGTDNAPTIHSNDFNSRFGLGYLFGISYQVSPKMVIDIRDVQTVWDNANTQGAKRVSSQLYRSPSFQVSIGYRFGGRRKE